MSGTLRQQPSGETRGRFADLYGGAGNSAVAAAQAGWECVALTEPHLPGRRLAAARLRGYSQEPELYSAVGEATRTATSAQGLELILIAAPPPRGTRHDVRCPDSLSGGAPRWCVWSWYPPWASANP